MSGWDPAGSDGLGADRTRRHGGKVEIIAGSMFSGKTEELIRRVKRALFARQTVQAFKPRIDDRYSKSQIVSHGAISIDAVAVATSDSLYQRVDATTQLVAIDEAQFFDRGIVGVVNRLADEGRRVIVAGLDQDYMGRPFDPMPQLLALAEEITKTLAICVRCGNPAIRTQRLVPSEERIVVGGERAYEARCRLCFEPRPIQETLSLKVEA